MTEDLKKWIEFNHDLMKRGVDLRADKIFKNENNLRNMLQHMWGFDEFHKNIKFHKLRSAKDDYSSNTMRELGTDHFKKRELNKALSCYNTSIINAVQPARKQSLDNSITLALGYGNRSAVLFEMQLYDLCLIDIRRAFVHSYPVELQQKLIKREIKCHFAKHDLLAARKRYKRYSTDKKYSHDAKLIESLKKLMSDLEKEFNKKKQNKKDVIIDEFPFFEDSNNMKANKRFPTFSDALQFTFSTEKGRGFIAKRDIMPGEVLMKEKAYLSCPLTSCLLTHCSYCLRRIQFAPLPCTSCTNVIFCDEKCKKNADQLFHKVECSMISHFVQLNVEDSVRLLRILCQTDVKQLLEQYKLYEKECTTMKSSEVGFNSDGVYQFESLQTVFHLANNRRFTGLHRMAYICFKSLICFKLFISKVARSDIPDINNLNVFTLSENQLSLAAAIVSLLMIMDCNTYRLSEFEQISINQLKSPDDYGYGLFLNASLINHSCNPNLFRSDFGFAQIGIASQLITAGSEICGTYGPCYFMESLVSRKIELQQLQDHYFNCSCKACTEDWPLYNLLPTNLKCNNCFDYCNNLGCTQCKEIYSHGFLQCMKMFANEVLVHASNTMIISSDKTPDKDELDDVKKNIILINKYCILPSKLFTDCQLVLRNILRKYVHLILSEFFTSPYYRKFN